MEGNQLGLRIFCAVLVIQLTLGQDDASDAGNAQLEVKIYPTREQITSDQGADQGLTCAVTGTADAVTWSKDGTDISASDKYQLTDNNGMKILLVKNLVSDDAGRYTCTATVSGSPPADKSVELEVNVAVEVSAKTEQFGIKGETKKLDCAHTGNPSPMLTWKFQDGTEIPKDGDKYKWDGNQDYLEINNLDENDNQDYTCNLFVIDTGSNTDHIIKFDVVELPVVNSFTMTPTLAMEGQEVTMTCDASGTPAPDFKFMKDGIALMEGVVDNVITIPAVSEDHQALYKCMAVNKGGNSTETLDLDVFVAPTIEDIGDEEKAQENAEFTKVCVVKGDPAPTVVWTGPESENGDALFTQESVTEGEDKKVQTVTNTLTIASVTNENGGEYTCTATETQTGGNEVAAFTLDVEYKPIFPEENNAEREFFGWKGHTAVLTCAVKANPAVVGITWTRGDGEVMTEAMTETMNGHITTSTLNVEVVDNDTSVYSTYTCSAKNKLNTDEPVTTEVELKEAFVPQQPTLETLETEILAMSVTIRAKKPADNGGQEVTQFEYMAKVNIDDDVQPSSKDAEEKDTRLYVSDLQPGVRYQVSVRAVNAVGKGEWQTINVTTKNNSKPERMQLINSQDGKDQTEFAIEWSEIQNGGSEVTKVTVRWQQVKVDADRNFKDALGDVKTHDIPPSELNMKKHVLKDLKAGSHYRITVIASNDIGDSDEFSQIIKTADKPKKQTESSSASLGSGGIIAIILALIVIVAIVVIVLFIVARRKPELLGKLRKGGRAGGEEEGIKEGGKDPAEEEKLIQKEDKVKVENEVSGAPPAGETQEFEPETKPDSPAPAVAEVSEQKPEEPAAPPAAPAAEEVKVQPESPGDKAPQEPGNPTA